jgi:hypothetical protein
MSIAARLLALAVTTMSAAAGTFALGAATTDCTPPAVPTSAIAIAQGVAQTATNVIADAQTLWPVVYTTIPAAQQAGAQKAYDEAIFTANHALLALDDTIAAAIAANSPNPDFTAVYSSLADAVGQVVAIVQQFTGSAAPVVARTDVGVDVVAA